MNPTIRAQRSGRLLSRLRSIAILAVEAQAEPLNLDKIGDALADIDDDMRAALALLDKLQANAATDGDE